MRRMAPLASPGKHSRGGAFSLATRDEPTLRKIGRWLLARGIKSLFACAFVLYVVVMCVFFISEQPRDASATAVNAVDAASQRVAAAANDLRQVNGDAHDATATALPAAELAVIHQVLGIHPETTAAANYHPTPSTSYSTDVLAAAASTTPPSPASSQSPDAIALQDELAAAVLAAALAPITTKDRKHWTVDDHAHELHRLRILRDTAQAEVVRLQAIVDTTKRLFESQATAYETILATRAIDFRLATPRRIRTSLECLGWKQTGNCDPFGPREPASDKACNQLLTGGVSGYCELVDPVTREHFRVMQLHCVSVRNHVSFSCTNAADFANFAIQSEHVLADAASRPLDALPSATGIGNGIVMVVYPKLMTSAYATIKTLRTLNCTLPIELWVLESEMARNPKKSAILHAIQQSLGPVHLRTIHDPTITGFTTKIHAISHSAFQNVLFLDADNVPVKDPTFLFTTREFNRNAALFWPDFWHPSNTIFNIQAQSLLWELVNMAPVDMFEQESGQLLINRHKSARALEVLQFYALHRPNHFDRLLLAHGDKDLFRLAWLKADAPFFMMPFPPGAAGTIRDATFCGMTMVQYDAHGDVLFLHRNAKKLNGRVNRLDESYWTHLQTFDWNYAAQDDDVEDEEEENTVVEPTAMPMKYAAVKRRYVIGIQSSAPLFREFQSCYGAEEAAYPYFNLTEWKELPFAGIEQQIIAYAHEAALLAKTRGA